MKDSELRKILKNDLRFLKHSEIAKQSGVSRQLMNYWLHDDPKGSQCNPLIGLNHLLSLCKKICTGEVTEETFGALKKYVKMSSISKQFFGVPSSTVNIYIDRNGIDQYRSQIKKLSSYVSDKLSDVKKRKSKSKNKKKFVIKVKKR